MSTMLAVAVTPGVPNSARLITMPRPEPVEGEVLVRVLRAGICGTDREILAGDGGRPPPDADLLVIGHESLGVVEHAPPDSGLRAGDRVTAIVRRPDGCPACVAGRWDVCLWDQYTERGIHGSHGFLCEYFTERPEFLVPVSPELGGTAVLVEPASVVAKALADAAHVRGRIPFPVEQAVVLGAGAIGLLSTMFLRFQGVAVSTLDVAPADSLKARLTRDAGATYIPATPQALAGLARDSGNIDLIIEATGHAPLLPPAIAALGTNGVLVLLGVTQGSSMYEMDLARLNWRMVSGNRALLGSINAARPHFEEGARLLSGVADRWPGLLDRMITSVSPLAGALDALKPDRDGIKSVVEVST